MMLAGFSEPKMAVPATITLLPKMTYQFSLPRSEGMLFTSFRTGTDGFGANTTVNFDIFIWESSA
jgi:hypothetical protein